MRRALFGWAAVVTTVVSASLSASEARAAFPGSSGRIVFVSARDGGDHIYSMRPDGSDVVRLTTGIGELEPRYSPDGQRIAFSRVNNVGGSGIRQIAVINGDGTNEIDLSKDLTHSDDSPAWSPDGSSLAFQRDGHLWVMNADSTGVRAITTDLALDAHPSWSPNGSRIVFWGIGSDGNWDIYLISPDGAQLTRLTTDPAHDAEPDWSPDGSKVVFWSRRDGLPQIYEMNADGSNQTNISHSGRYDAQPAWSPDGNQIAFGSAARLVDIPCVAQRATEGCSPCPRGSRLSSSVMSSPSPAGVI